LGLHGFVAPEVGLWGVRAGRSSSTRGGRSQDRTEAGEDTGGVLHVRKRRARSTPSTPRESRDTTVLLYYDALRLCNTDQGRHQRCVRQQCLPRGTYTHIQHTVRSGALMICLYCEGVGGQWSQLLLRCGNEVGHCLAAFATRGATKCERLMIVVRLRWEAGGKAFE
jgi:hypothetical protein